MTLSTCCKPETHCPKSEDTLHCQCWYDGLRCCKCDDDAVVHTFVARKGGGFICLDCRETEE